MPPLANGTAVNKGMSLAISCCQPPNRSAISLTTLILLVSAARRMQPTRQNTVIHRRWKRTGRGKERGKGKWKGRDGKKEREGGDGGPLRDKGVERGGKGGDGGPICGKGWKREGRGGRKGKEEWRTNPYSWTVTDPTGLHPSLKVKAPRRRYYC